jgi:hypothetical protein
LARRGFVFVWARGFFAADFAPSRGFGAFPDFAAFDARRPRLATLLFFFVAPFPARFAISALHDENDGQANATEVQNESHPAYGKERIVDPMSADWKNSGQ